MFDTKEDILEIIKAKPELRHKTSALLIGFYATNALNVPELYGPQKVGHKLHSHISIVTDSL